MISNPIILIFLLFSALIPIVIWGYLFSYFDAGEFNRKRFFYGILAGVVSVFPVLYLGNIIDNFSLGFLNIFKNVYNLNTFSGVFWLFLSLFSFIILVSIIPFFINIFGKSKNDVLVLLKNTVIFLFFMFVISFIFFFLKKTLGNFSFSDSTLNSYPTFGNIAFNSVSLVIFYYLIIGLIEEISKFFSFNYSKNFKIIEVRQGVLFAIFTALGFAFFENILYFHTMLKNYSIGQEFLGVYFSRNLFSVFLHIICSSIFAYYFGVAYVKYYNKLKYVQVLFIGFILSVFLHGMFDIFLTFDMTFIIFLYLIGGYFYLSYIFYSRD